MNTALRKLQFLCTLRHYLEGIIVNRRIIANVSIEIQYKDEFKWIRRESNGRSAYERSSIRQKQTHSVSARQILSGRGSRFVFMGRKINKNNKSYTENLAWRYICIAVVTVDPGSNPDQKYARRRDRQICRSEE
jgi:hypothetical protein